VIAIGPGKNQHPKFHISSVSVSTVLQLPGDFFAAADGDALATGAGSGAHIMARAGE
jgi:hypothetical protein